jgi:dihydropteroate synthase
MAVFPRKPYVLNLKSRSLAMGGRTLVMGIVNVTPDSFSDAGECYDYQAAVQRASEMVAAGADLLDIGGESTRPSADPLPVDLELERVIPVITAIRKQSDIPISIDTTKAEVARQALTAGADIINDVSALRFDDLMVEVAARSGAPLVLMHMQGTPRTMQQNPTYVSLFSEIIAFLEDRMRFAADHGVDRQQLIIDPGVGFGKNLHHNLSLIRNLEIFHCLDRPLLLGASRKRFIGSVLDRPVQDRELGTAVAHSFGIAAGVHIIRTHDVAFHRQVVLMSDAIREPASDKGR